MNEYSSVLQRADIGTTGTSQDIVGILNAYNRALPIDFLAHVLKRSPVDLEPDLKILQEKDVLKTEAGMVHLIPGSVGLESRRQRALST
ncbi:MAG TPA: hypothetical protein VF511_00980 [Chthoniobacterales bacterium]